MGRPRIPSKILELRGSRWAGSHPNEPQPALADSIPPPPKWLSKKGRAHWKHLAETLMPVGILSSTDHVMLGLFAEALEEYLSARHEVETEGRYIITEKGNKIQHPAVGVMHKARESLMKLAGQFAMTPATRSLVSVGRGHEKTDPAQEKKRFFTVG